MEIIGVKSRIQLSNIHRMLEVLGNIFSHRCLDINAEEHVRVAVIHMDQLLRDRKSYAGSIPSLVPLYLPNKNMKMSKSTKLFFIDTAAKFKKSQLSNLEYGESAFDLFQTPAAKEKLPQMGPKRRHFSEKDFCLLLPREVRPSSLSLTCQEAVSGGRVFNEGSETPLSEHINSLIRLVEKITSVLPSMIYSATGTEESNPMPQAFVDKFQEILQAMSVAVYESLKVEITLPQSTSGTRYISVGECSAEFSLQNQDDGTYKLFVDSDSKPNLTLYKDLSLCLCIEAARANQLPLHKYLSYRSVVEDVVSVSNTKGSKHYQGKVQPST